MNGFAVDQVSACDRWGALDRVQTQSPMCVCSMCKADRWACTPGDKRQERDRPRPRPVFA